jgi:glycosyltransferase involved in cell wall biosynthesis
MRVRNEARWMERAVKSILPVCDKIWVLDNHSEDNTWRIAAGLGCHVLESPFSDLDEARDNTWLLDAAMSGIPNVRVGPLSDQWFLHIDGDEELLGIDRGKLGDDMLWGTAPNWSVQIMYLWGDEGTVRVDAHYGRCYRPSLFRAVRRGMTYHNLSGKIHSTGVPKEIGYTPRLHEPEPVRLLHYGYMEAETRERKFEWYMSVDPKQEEFYRRECFGPVTTAPLSSILNA